MTTSRLVYRGGLSLPDSHLILDGIAFSALLKPHTTLLQNPLALALESLRGIPLRFIALVALEDIYYDSETAPHIALDIHPQAFISQVYFSNIFCLNAEKSALMGVRVALGDTDATNIVIYASKVGKDEVQLMAARIMPRPSVLPRPDDPTPRQPPPVLSAKGRDLFPSLPMVLPVKSKKPTPEFKVPMDPAPILERKNKDLVKSIVARTIPKSLPKSHPEYKETFLWIYRGVCFALRGDMRDKTVDPEHAARLARVHIGMYVKS